MARVCRRWRQIAYDTRLWRNVSLRPEVSGLHVGSLDMLLSLISVRFGASLRYIELPIELITHTVLHELAAKCPNLTQMLLDFSTAMQLHDFSEMQAFPTKLRYMCICLSEVIFMEGFMRKIYNFINGLEVCYIFDYLLCNHVRLILTDSFLWEKTQCVLELPVKINRAILCNVLIYIYLFFGGVLL